METCRKNAAEEPASLHGNTNGKPRSKEFVLVAAVAMAPSFCPYLLKELMRPVNLKEPYFNLIPFLPVIKRGRLVLRFDHQFGKSPCGCRHVLLLMEVGDRDRAPMHYLLKIESFSKLSELLSEITEKRCEFTAFEAGGYKWKLVLYPVGDKARNGDGHISLYLMIIETNSLPRGWTVHANFQFFVYDHVQDRFCSFEGSNAKVRCFHAVKTELGFPKLLPLRDFKDPSKGYLIGDACVFGVQVLVQDYIENLECLSTSKFEDKPFSWKIQHFSEQNEKMIESESFIAGGLEWVVQLFPKGNPDSAANLSMYLKLKDSAAESILICARFSLLIKDQRNRNDLSFTVTATGSNFACGYGRLKFISLSRLQNPAFGFLVDDTLVIEAKAETISKLQSIS